MLQQDHHLRPSIAELTQHVYLDDGTAKPMSRNTSLVSASRATLVPACHCSSYVAVAVGGVGCLFKRLYKVQRRPLPLPAAGCKHACTSSLPVLLELIVLGCPQAREDALEAKLRDLEHRERQVALREKLLTQRHALQEQTNHQRKAMLGSVGSSHTHRALAAYNRNCKQASAAALLDQRPLLIPPTTTIAFVCLAKFPCVCIHYYNLSPSNPGQSAIDLD